MFHHSPVGVLQLARLAESDGVGEGLQGLLKGLQVDGELLLVNVFDQELAELQGFHHLLLHQLAVGLIDKLKILGRENTAKHIYADKIIKMCVCSGTLFIAAMQMGQKSSEFC